MQLESLTPILNVSDVPASLAWFEGIGWSRSFTWNGGGEIAEHGDANEHGPADFAGLELGDTMLFLCLDGQGGRGEHGAWMSWWLPDEAAVDAAYAVFQERGVEVLQAPRDEPWGARECLIRHPDGHTFRVSGSC